MGSGGGLGGRVRGGAGLRRPRSRFHAARQAALQKRVSERRDRTGWPQRDQAQARVGASVAELAEIMVEFPLWVRPSVSAGSVVHKQMSFRLGDEPNRSVRRRSEPFGSEIVGFS
jgi:hypothetical protein